MIRQSLYLLLLPERYPRSQLELQKWREPVYIDRNGLVFDVGDSRSTRHSLTNPSRPHVSKDEEWSTVFTERIDPLCASSVDTALLKLRFHIFITPSADPEHSTLSERNAIVFTASLWPLSTVSGWTADTAPLVDIRATETFSQM